MKKNNIKIIIVSLIILIIAILLFLIYENLFADHGSARNNEFSNYNISDNEINSVKDKIKEIEQVKEVDIHTNNDSKIIKIIVNLSDDVKFDDMKKIAKESITNFSEDNLSYFDIEFFIDTEKEDSEIYPRIGYKVKSNEDFSW